MDEEVKNEKLKSEDTESSAVEQIAETKELVQSPEIGQHDNLADLKTAIEAADVPGDLKGHTDDTAQSLQSASDDQKVQELLAQAKAKGVVFAVQVAKKLNNPYVLDKLHDTLVANGEYKKFLK